MFLTVVLIIDIQMYMYAHCTRSDYESNVRIPGKEGDGTSNNCVCC